MALTKPIIIKTKVDDSPLYINLNALCTVGTQYTTPKVPEGEETPDPIEEFVMFNQVGYAVRLVVERDISREEVARIFAILEENSFDLGKGVNVKRKSDSDEATKTA